MTVDTASWQEHLFGEARRNWGWLLALGIISIVLGTLGLGSLFVLTLVSVLFIGWLILIGGAIELFQVVKCRGWRSRLWQLLIAVLHIAAGLVVLFDPVLASGVLTLFLGIVVLAGGIARLVVAFHHRDHRGWGWLLLSGIAGAVLGALILIRWPASSFFVIGLFLAVELLFNGWSLVVLALAARGAGRPSGAAEQPV